MKEKKKKKCDRDDPSESSKRKRRSPESQPSSSSSSFSSSSFAVRDKDARGADDNGEFSENCTEICKSRKRHKSAKSSDGEKIERKKHKKSKKKHKKKHDRQNERKMSSSAFGPLPPDDIRNSSESHGPSKPSDEMLSVAERKLAPMTKEQWEKERSTIRRVYDPETGRNRLIRGNGEILEEIVSKKRHVEINQRATIGDGVFYQYKAGLASKPAQ